MATTSLSSHLLLESLLASLTPGRITVLVILLTIASFAIDSTTKPAYPRSLPRVGYTGGIRATIRNWMNLSNYHTWVEQGYNKYGKQGRSFVTPASPSQPDEIVLPQEQIAWMLEQPETVLSTQESHKDVLFGAYNFFNVDDHFPTKVMHKHLARNLVTLLPDIQQEVVDSIDIAFGVDTENWNTINLWEALLTIVPRVMNRLAVGLPLCRNQAFLSSQVGFADDVFRNCLILTLFPTVLHPLVGRLVTLPNWYHFHQGYRLLKPIIEERLRDYERFESGESQTPPPQESLITWLIRQAKADNLAHEQTPYMIAMRLLPIEFAAIHTTVITLHALFLDLFASDPAKDYLSVLREETTTVLQSEPNGIWTKNGLARLYRTDSAIRESMRLSTFSTGLTHRKVVAKEGITNPFEGWHAPYGAVLMANMSVQHDPDIYEDPQTYDAWRFSRVREEYEARSEKEKEKGTTEEALRVKRLGLVTTSGEHLPFSHGRHACPGRFFVAHEVKMMLSHILQNYDIKPIANRPPPTWVAHTIIPALDVKIEVKRRRGKD
ncbi:cytochrome P450 [Copromyces sp. CBS 386.78]|nr:cytochrome P450 [Copromyces sp. CBS 386.78]